MSSELDDVESRAWQHYCTITAGAMSAKDFWWELSAGEQAAMIAATQNDNFTDLRTANLARQKEWDPSDKITLSYRGNELAGEVGEACNVLKKIERERLGIAGSRDTVEHLAEELADVIICVDLLATAMGIDLDAAVRAKFNATSEKVGLRTRLVAA